MSHVGEIKRKELLGHPMGLFVLFFTEMWERFSYYGMRAILVLYMCTSETVANAGLGWEKASALELYGWYTMLVYIMSIPGGIIADKILGQKKSVMWGGLILCLGHGILAIEEVWAFYTGLALIVLGVGGLKPNISTMVGGLYKQGDARRDKGFTIFYIGINLGAAASALLVGWMGENIGWHWGFGAAGVGMLLGQLVYMLGQKHLVGVGDKPVKVEGVKDDTSIGILFGKIFKTPWAMIVGGIFAAAGIYKFATGGIGYGFLFVFLGLVAGMLRVIYGELEDKPARDKFVVLLLSFIVVIVFWGAFEQAGGLMNLYTEAKVNRELMGWTIPASVFQSVNAIFIIIFGTIVAGFWAWMKKTGKESSSLFKMAIGTMVMGLGFLFMVQATNQVMDGGKAMMILIIAAYLLHTLGELSASPVALSFITKLAPAKYAALMMGVYFAATGLGNKVAGTIGEASQLEMASVELTASANLVQPYINSDASIADTSKTKVLSNAKNFTILGKIYSENGELKMIDSQNNQPLLGNYFSTEDMAILEATMDGEETSAENPYKLIARFENKTDQVKLAEAEFLGKEHKVDLSNYSGKVEIFEVANNQEKKTFIMITAFTVVFGLLLLLFLKKLKKLTHGVEEQEN